jgi:colanic acid/amylovoran biosynthesis glycosyltransferase
MQKEIKKIAFIVGKFPAVSETFIINQVADLKDNGIQVEVFSFVKGGKENISQRFYDYKMGEKVSYLNMPLNIFSRILFVLPKVCKILFLRPKLLFKALNFKKYGKNALSLKLLYWIAPFIGKENEFDLIHCHFGTIANKFLLVKDMLGLKQKIITTFYGIDISQVPKNKPAGYYDRLIKESSLFFMMSENMKQRALQQGFPVEKMEVLPISVEVGAYPFAERKLEQNEEVRLMTVGRFVEKKGLDDLLRALAIVKEKTSKKFRCIIVGDGPLREQLYSLADKLKLKDILDFRGYMKLEDVINLFMKAHFFVQPSKTARDGDME